MASVSLSKHFTVLTSILLICGLVVVLGKIQERRNEEQNSRHKERLSLWKRADIPVGTTCALHGVDQCVNGAQCVEISAGAHECRIPVGQTCTDVNECSPNMTCDVRTGDNGGKKCRYSEGSTGCTSDQNCVPGATCDHGNTCTTAAPTTTAAITIHPVATTLSTNPGVTAQFPNVGNCAINSCRNEGICANSSTGNNFSCLCNMTRFKGPLCETELAAPGHHCTDKTDCRQPADCTNNNDESAKRCICGATYYNDTVQGVCVPRKMHGEDCFNNVTSSSMCIGQTMCRMQGDSNVGVCECTGAPDTEYFDNVSRTCKTLLKHGEYGCHDNVTGPCIPNAECIYPSPTLRPAWPDNGTCECKHGLYDDQDGFCVKKRGLGVSCQDTKECVETATCTSSRSCGCAEDYYIADELEQHCSLRQRLNGVCHVTYPHNECLVNGTCVNNTCQCADGFYARGHNCTGTLSNGIQCELGNPDQKQCESNTKCVFRAEDDHPVCGCDTEHFFNGKECEQRALASDPCPYDPNDAYYHSTITEILKQCVEHAVCSNRLICECDDKYYLRAGHCPRRIASHDACDPWANYPNQCEGGRACLHGHCGGPA